MGLYKVTRVIIRTSCPKGPSKGEMEDIQFVSYKCPYTHVLIPWIRAVVLVMQKKRWYTCQDERIVIIKIDKSASHIGRNRIETDVEHLLWRTTAKWRPCTLYPRASERLDTVCPGRASGGIPHLVEIKESDVLASHYSTAENKIWNSYKPTEQLVYSRWMRHQRRACSGTSSGLWKRTARRRSMQSFCPYNTTKCKVNEISVAKETWPRENINENTGDNIVKILTNRAYVFHLSTYSWPRFG